LKYYPKCGILFLTNKRRGRLFPGQLAAYLNNKTLGVYGNIIHPPDTWCKKESVFFMPNFKQTAPNLSHEISISIIDEITKIVPYLSVEIPEQINLRNAIEEKLNDYEITSRCTDLVKGDILEHAYVYLATKKLEGISELTLYNYKLVLKMLNDNVFKPVAMITTVDLRIFLARVYKDNKAITLNTKISMLKTFFQWLQDEGYIIQNPAKKLNIIKEPIRRRGHIEQIDIEKMREQCVTIREKALFEFILSTGCRVSEISDAKLDKINWTDNSIDVIGKGNKERNVLFSTRARMFLIEYIQEREKKGILSNCLFVSSKKPYFQLGTRSIEKAVNSIAERAGININVFPHLFRHTYATTGVNHDVPVHVLQQLMGHSSPSTTQIYYEISEDTMKQAYKKIAL
jgi:integrase/recombinase XerD